MRSERGFTLIELMIVVAIIATLAAIALPAYQDFTVRARIAESIVLAGGAKATVTENINNANLLDDSACSGVPTLANATANVAALSCMGHGVLIVTSTARAGAVTLTLSPTYNVDAPVQWRCTRTAGSNRHVPPDCRA